MDKTHPSQARRGRRTASARQEAETIAAVNDPIGRTALRAAYHARRYSVIYVLGFLALIALVLMPSVAPAAGSDLASAGGLSTGGAYGNPQPQAGSSGGAAPSTAPGTAPTGAAAAPGPAAGSGVAGGAGAAGSGRAGGATTGGGAAAPGPPGTVQVGSGQTVGGFPCGPGVHQLPYSLYAAPCVAKFTGNNGGATYNGVTSTTITIALRTCSDASGPNAASVYALDEQAGADPPDKGEAYMKQLLTYFSQVFELYGRHIVTQDYTGSGNCTSESTSQGQAAACADADTAANSIHAFSDLNPYNGLYESEPFAQCAAKYHMYLGFAQLYFPESEYQAEDPYIWSPPPSCTVGGSQLAEFIGKQLAPYPAKWAGTNNQLPINGSQRKFAIFTPTNQGYQDCADNTVNLDVQNYGVAKNRFDRYSYDLNIQDWPSEANAAATQFKADQDTSIVLSCDPLIPIFLTQDAANALYQPEWVLEGVALTDQDNLAQLWDQSEIKGHLFGMSQLGSTAKFQDPNGEAARTLKAAGVPVDPGTILGYYELLPMMDQLQAAGPILTPANIKAGTRSLPRLGGSTAADGTWYFGNTHTAIIDSREIYYDESRTSANGKPGTYVEIYGGRRFEVGQYPAEQAPFYPS
jgi:hypothetical protein